MFRKYFMVLTMLLALPTFAHAWSVNAKSSNAAQGAISPAGNATYATGVNSAEYTVTPAAGFSLSRVTLDGVAIAPNAGGKYVAPYAAGKSWRYLVAYFKTNTVNITTTAGAGGVIREDNFQSLTNIPVGSARQLQILPNPGYTIASVTAAGATVTGDTAYQLVEYTNLQANQTVSATFALTPVVTVNAGNNVTTTGNGAAYAATLRGEATSNQGAITYAWTGAGLTFGTADAAVTTVYSNTPGVYTATLTVTSGAETRTDTAQVTVTDAMAVQVSVCTSCHADSTPAIVTAFNTGSHENSDKLAAEVKTCQTCHTDAPHNKFGGASCIGCHSVAQNAGAGFVQDNAGVRAIKAEFEKWSHHVTGVKLNDAHCAACHLEGKAEAGKIVVDQTYHMADAQTHLRNADTDADFAWDPAAPDHTLMDNFCMSCHDDNGATSTGSLAIQALINATGVAAKGKTASPSNPFGDTISNRYDKMQRPAVVDAKGQFNTANPSHHAVLGQRYTKKTRVINAADPRAMTAAEVAAFTANSSATLVGKRSTIADSRVKKSGVYDVSKFVETYRTLSPAPGTSDYTLGDDSVLHCGDCHTVGQWKANAAYNADGTLAPAAIGAHGSNNEYMLRNNRGTDERHVGQTYSSASGVNYYINAASEPWLVCFNCHSYQAYGSIGNATGATGTNHAGEYANSTRCNGPVNTISFAGYTTSINAEHEPYAFRLGLGQPDKTWSGATTTSDTDFSNLFGIQCLNCHNSGPNNGFGGIHGSKIQSYTDANGAEQKAYRFLPGLGNTMYVPGSAAGVGSVSDLNWEVYAISTKYNAAKLAGQTPAQALAAGAAVIDNGGCYTIVPEEGPGGTNADYALSPAFEQKAYDGTTHIFGTWGGCDDHRGNAHGKAFSANGVPAGDYSGGTVPTGGAGVTRKVLRPVTY